MTKLRGHLLAVTPLTGGPQIVVTSILAMSEGKVFVKASNCPVCVGITRKHVSKD